MSETFTNQISAASHLARERKAGSSSIPSSKAAKGRDF